MTRSRGTLAMSNLKNLNAFLDVKNILLNSSDDPHTQVCAAFINKHGTVMAGASNQFYFIPDLEIAQNIHNDKQLKYKCIEHAERSLIYKCLRHSIPIKDCDMYVYINRTEHSSSNLVICNDCLRALIQVGVTNVYVNYDPDTHCDLSKQIIQEAGVKICRI